MQTLSKKNHSSPVHLAWQCTNACNLKCIHCYANAGTKSKEELQTEEAIKLISSAYQLGIKSIIFSGGEPFLRSDILKLLEHTHGLGLFPIIATNGTLIDRQTAKIIKALGVSVAVNMPAATSKTYRMFTHSDFHDAALTGITYCVEEKVPLSLGIAVSKINLGEVEEVIDFAISMNVFCDVLATIPAGRASLSLLPDPREYAELLNMLYSKYSAVPMNMTSGNSQTLVTVYEPIYTSIIMQKKRCDNIPKLCALGKLMHVMEDGSVRTCVFLPLSLGNIREETLADIWNRLINSWFLKELLDPGQLKGPCGICGYKYACGGCRTRCYNITGDWFASDPMCTQGIRID